MCAQIGGQEEFALLSQEMRKIRKMKNKSGYSCR
jgi:hypothetical protein